jgi:hypothetical protein
MRSCYVIFSICFERFEFTSFCFSGATPLHWSSREKHPEVCQFLVSSKADVIAKDNRFGIESYARMRTCYVIFSICFERFEFTSFFRGRTPLHWSSHDGHIEVCQFLVSSKADVIAKDNECDIDSYARMRSCYAIFSICFERFEFTYCFRGWTPLHWSSLKGHLDVCQFLVSSKADVVAKDNECVIESYARMQSCYAIFSICLDCLNSRHFSEVGPHCIYLYRKVILKCASFSSRPIQALLQMTSLLLYQPTRRVHRKA